MPRTSDDAAYDAGAATYDTAADKSNGFPLRGSGPSTTLLLLSVGASFQGFSDDVRGLRAVHILLVYAVIKGDEDRLLNTAISV